MSHRFFPRAALALVCAGLASAWATPALAGPRDVRLLPPRLEPVASATPVDLQPLAQKLGGLLEDAMLDFGLHPLEEPGSPPALLDEQALTALAVGAWVVQPELALRGSEIVLRLSVVPQGSSVLLVRVQHFDPAELEVRSLSMLRELVEPALGGAREPCPEAPPALPSSPSPVRSSGRAVLALHTAAFGGYLGYTLQRAAGSDDARLTYPLAALGAGVGLGSAVVVSEEWDVTLGRAWFVGAGMLWPATGVALLTRGEQTHSERRLLSLAAATGGVTLATAGIALGNVDEGSAAFTHSGALLGMLIGGLSEMIVRGDAEARPEHGLGYGVLGGVAIAGVLATQFQMPAPSSVLIVDLGALLGGLGGAAIGTPLLVSQEPSPARDRAWLSGVLLGTLAGGGLGYWLMRSEESSPQRAPSEASSFELTPELGWMGSPLGFGVTGSW